MTTRKTVERVAAELVDIAGLAEHLGLTAKTIRTDVIRRPGFPAPITTFGQSKVWWLDDVDEWDATARRRPGRPGATVEARRR
jgi:hypothetical protein